MTTPMEDTFTRYLDDCEIETLSAAIARDVMGPENPSRGNAWKDQFQSIMACVGFRIRELQRKFLEQQATKTEEDHAG